nr:Chain C, PEPTIDE INHIBITOR [synthetic construct]1HC9_D Chain D, PEPTIDE INHIBITOR [synthetic construct]
WRYYESSLLPYPD